MGQVMFGRCLQLSGDPMIAFSCNNAPGPTAPAILNIVEVSRSSSSLPK